MINSLCHNNIKHVSNYIECDIVIQSSNINYKLSIKFQIPAPFFKSKFHTQHVIITVYTIYDCTTKVQDAMFEC